MCVVIVLRDNHSKGFGYAISRSKKEGWSMTESEPILRAVEG